MHIRMRIAGHSNLGTQIVYRSQYWLCISESPRSSVMNNGLVEEWCSGTEPHGSVAEFFKRMLVQLVPRRGPRAPVSTSSGTNSKPLSVHMVLGLSFA